MKELLVIHWFRKSWRNWLRIKRAELLLWWRLPGIKAAGPHVQDPAVKRYKVPLGDGENTHLVFTCEGWSAPEGFDPGEKPHRGTVLGPHDLDESPPWPPGVGK